MAEVEDHSPHQPHLQDADDIAKPSLKAKDEAIVRKVICRYGCGCTHILDPAHREKFWHPKIYKLDEDRIKSHFICNECGYATSSLPDLQLHLKRKTAWSNMSLVGCRINCLVDCKEWHEGYVTQYHKSGKHLVEFRAINEKRWLIMKKMAFYIVERPVLQNNNDGGEFKDNNSDNDNLAPFEDSWVYVEDISLEYAFAQSVLFKIYGNNLQETGHLTKGHICLTENDRSSASSVKSSLLYGELLPRGANKALGHRRLEAFRAQSLFDLGMGTGKIVIQAFLQYRNLKYCFGVELSQGRYKLAEEAAIKMVQLLGSENYSVQMNPGKYIIITEAVRISSTHDVQFSERVLHFQCGNMFDTQNLESADIIMMETDVPVDLHPNLHRLASSLKDGARMLSYLDLRRLCDIAPLPLRQIDINRHLSDRYPTSWSVQRGHHFFLWQKTMSLENNPWNGIALGLGSLVSHDLSSNSVGTMTSVQVNKPSSPAAGLPFISRDNSFETRSEDLDSSRCFPFGIRFGFGGRSGKKSGKQMRTVIDESMNISPADPLAAASNSPPPTSAQISPEPPTPLPSKLSAAPTSPALKLETPKRPELVKPLNLTEVRKAGSLSPNETLNPPKSDRSKSSTNGNIVLNDDVLNDVAAGMSSGGKFSPIQPSNDAGEIESFGTGEPTTASTLQFPPDIRSRIRTSPLQENKGQTGNAKNVQDSSQKHSSKKKTTQSPRRQQSNSPSIMDQGNLSPVTPLSASQSSQLGSATRQNQKQQQPLSTSLSVSFDNEAPPSLNLPENSRKIQVPIQNPHSLSVTEDISPKRKIERNLPLPESSKSNVSNSTSNIHNQQYQNMINNPPPATYQINRNDGNSTESSCIIS